MQIPSPAVVVAFMAAALIANCCLSVHAPVQIIDCGGSPCTLIPFPPPPPAIIEPCPPPPPPASVTTCPPEIMRAPSQPGKFWPPQPYYALSPPTVVIVGPPGDGNVYSMNPYYYTSGVGRSWSAMAILPALVGVAISLLWWC